MSREDQAGMPALHELDLRAVRDEAKPGEELHRLGSVRREARRAGASAAM